MSEVVAALAGGALVGLFTLAITVVQQRQVAQQSALQHERQRELAAEQHAREVTTAQNRELSGRLDEQLAWGDTITKAVWRVTEGMRGVTDEHERYEILGRAVRMFGLNFDQPAQGSRLLPPDFFEDPTLRQLVSQHRERLFELEWAFIVADGRPDNLPDDPEAEFRRVADLKLRIEMQRRQLLRAGTPL